MSVYVPPLLGLGVAFSITFIELITSEYPRTPFFCVRSIALYSYSTIYGTIGFGIALGLGSLTEANILTLEGPGFLENPWVQAFIVGLIIKSLLHIRVFSVGTGADSFPIGIETIVQIFEPWLLRTIQLDHFNTLRSYIDPRANIHNDLYVVKQQITRNLPSAFSDREKIAFQADIAKATTVVDAMELYIGFAGKRSFNRIFPT